MTGPTLRKSAFGRFESLITGGVLWGCCEFRPADAHKFCSPFSIGATASLDPGGPCPSWVRRLLPGTPDLRAGHSLDRPVCPCAGGQRLPSAWVHVGLVQAEEPQRCTQCRGGARGLLPRDHSGAPATGAWGAGTVAALWTCPLLQTARFLALDEVALTVRATSEWSACCWPREVRSSR